MLAPNTLTTFKTAQSKLGAALASCYAQLRLAEHDALAANRPNLSIETRVFKREADPADMLIKR